MEHIPREVTHTRFRFIAIILLYACAALQFTRFYTVSTPQYLDMQAYLHGTERLPFQERVLPAILLHGISALTQRFHIVSHANGAYTADRSGILLISFFSLLVASAFTQALYMRCSAHRSLPALVFPILLFTMLWSYVIHTEANFAYPYDFLSVAFFSAGLWSIHARRYAWLAIIVVLGTFNRETTLFLIAIYVIDATFSPQKATSARQFPWLKTLLLCMVWVGIKLGLAHHYRGNSHAEDYVRLRENLGRIGPRLWPALLNICGYSVPLVLVFRRDLSFGRLRRWLWIIPVWIAVMFYTGVIVETRIYGELCPLMAVFLVLIAEEHASNCTNQPS